MLEYDLSSPAWGSLNGGHAFISRRVTHIYEHTWKRGLFGVNSCIWLISVYPWFLGRDTVFKIAEEFLTLLGCLLYISYEKCFFAFWPIFKRFLFLLSRVEMNVSRFYAFCKKVEPFLQLSQGHAKKVFLVKILYFQKCSNPLKFFIHVFC